MEELYKKDINETDYYDGVVSHPEPDILECEVKWALRSTAVKVDAMQSSNVIQNPKGWCYQIVALNMSANLEDPAVAARLEKVSHPNSQDNCSHLLCW